MPRFVLEIGTEEIPPRFFPPAMSQLREDGEKMLRQARLSYDEVSVYGTPRRLVLLVEGLAAKQAAETREERGPASKVAFDENGKPTKAAEGFARRHGLAPSDLEVRQTEQGEYVFAVIQEPELSAGEALAAALPALITGLSFPKSMRWGTGSVRFGRPIRWLLALVDDEVVEFPLEHLQSDRLTRGHPVLSDGMHAVPSAGDYEEVLRSHSILVKPDERQAEIAQQIDALAGAESSRIVDNGLLEETTFLVEWPTATCGAFDPEFLRLPRPVLIDEMQHIQSYFPLQDEAARLQAKFIAVRDGGREHLETVLAGWESVLGAKLIDATYFYEEDLKRPLADRVEDLKGVVFQERLGTMYDKAERIRAIAAKAGEGMGLSADALAHLDRAALLCKADLTTQVVAELSALQGAMGREYALASEEDEEVAEAIGEHYRPRFSGDDVPKTKSGRLLALADKLDTLAGLFAIGAEPTGSTDPFGLRREAYGVVNILVTAGEEVDRDEQFAISLETLLATALEALRQQVELKKPTADMIARVTDFLRERLAVFLRDQGTRYDLVDAALAVGVDDVSQAEKRAQALQKLQPREDFLSTVVACTRPLNIAKGFEGGDVAPDLFQEPAENALWEAYQQVVAEAESANLIELFALISGQLREPIDRYFDDVLVMAEDEQLRHNRLALCWHLSRLFRRLGDLSIVVQA
ncbi:MAG: glycine--tRNA ligase subunit beta [Armatimonadetes bacterium]|nr:glycine--tRNA ligase subunit beta [Armatimonadota bacterium]